ncbi:MAG: hypothetical protein IKA36_04110 [Clostridia bacterium]|nr:hypothetical protein [Clostridia bacterium]
MYDASKFFTKNSITYGTGAINRLMAEQISPIINQHFDAIVANNDISKFRKKLHMLINAKSKNKSWFKKICDLCQYITDLGTDDYFEIGCDTGIIVMFYLLLWLEKEENDTVIPVIPELKINSYIKPDDNRGQCMFILEFEFKGEYLTICDMRDIMEAEMLISDSNHVSDKYQAERVAFTSSVDNLMFDM